MGISSTIETLPSPARAAGVRAGNVKTAVVARPRSLRRNVTSMFFANVTYAGCQWAQLVVLAKFGGPEALGAFAWGLAVTAPVLMAASLQLRTLQATDVNGQFAFREYLQVRLLTCGLAMLALLTIALISAESGEQWKIMLALGVAKCFEAISDILFGLFQRHQRMALVATSLVVRGFVSVAALTAGLIIFNDACAAVVVMALAWLAVLACYDGPNAWRMLAQGRQYDDVSQETLVVRSRISVSRLLALGIKGLPLGLVVGANSLNQNIPRYILESSHGARQLGFFAGVAAFMRIGFYVESALTQSSISQLANLSARQDQGKFYSLVLKLVALAAGVGILSVLVSAVLGRTILELLYDSEFAQFQNTFICVNAAAAIGYVAGVLKSAADARQAMGWQLPLMAGTAAISIGSGLVLIPRYALFGAGLVLIVSKLCLLIGYTGILAFTHRHFKGSVKAT